MDSWQSILSFAIVAAAGIWLVRRAVRTVARGLKAKAGECVSCSKCVMNPTTKKENKLVQLGGPPTSDE
ncbi:hypothetical protein [Novipirellula artificiosorum]|uniref:hypothetical protein n=1 Tax=Novipirellula artificiosorum TaxID=2528016 RepID=UPI0018CEDEF6|nr:hypothetical protein [Novipirellula artificiosorum]